MLVLGHFQNITIEERMEILEGQVVIILNEVSDIETDVDFLFEEQIIQDERLFSLEQTVFVIDEDVEGNCNLQLIISNVSTII